MAGRGFNTFHGFDNGPAPPGFAPNQPPGMAQYPSFFAPPATFPVVQPGFAPVPTVMGHPMMPQQATYPAPYGFPHPAMIHPAPPPTGGGIPGVHFKNPSGGVGLPPGYDYLFPSEHTTIHCFQTGPTPPWQITSPPGQLLPHLKVFVPVNTTIKEMMQRLGCDNKHAEKNVLHEVVEKGNGGWAKGITIKGDDEDKVKKAISEFGWDARRTGFPGQRPVVWLYLTKD